MWRPLFSGILHVRKSNCNFFVVTLGQETLISPHIDVETSDFRNTTENFEAEINLSICLSRNDTNTGTFFKSKLFCSTFNLFGTPCVFYNGSVK